MAKPKHSDLKVEWLSPDKLTPYERNARTHTDEQVEQIARSLDEFGWTNPILVDKKHGLVAGHGRLLAARKRKHKQVPVIVLEGLTEQQRRAYAIADNKLALNSDWDWATLRAELGDLKMADIDLTLLGFGQQEIASFFGTAAEIEALWGGMPEFDQTHGDPNEAVYRRIVINFRNAEDVVAFAALLGQDVTEKTRFLWYPVMVRVPTMDKQFVAGNGAAGSEQQPEQPANG